MKQVSSSGARIGGACREMYWGTFGATYKMCMLETCESGMDAFIMVSDGCLMLSCTGIVSVWGCDYGFGQTCGEAFVKEEFVP